MTHAIRLFLFLSFVVMSVSHAQDKNNLSDEINIDNLGNNTDEFQEAFFKAIAQRAVENPTKAIEELERCLKLEPESTAVFYELAKNYIVLKDYEKAEKYLLKTLDNPVYKKNVNIHKQLFHVYSMQKSYDKAISHAKFISESDPLYFQELANLYLIQNEYQLALEALDQYDAVDGIDEFRDDFRMIIYKEGSILKDGIKFFRQRFENSKEDTRAATSLMELYRLNNSPQKAIDVGKELEALTANDPQINVELAMAYLITKNIPQAKAYSRKVVESLTLDETDKVKVINTFKALAIQDPEAQDAFVSILDSALSSEKNSSSKAEFGEFYKSRDKDKALESFKSALQNKPNDFKLIKNILELEMELKRYVDVIETSDKALESFPSQSYLYYAKGFALGKLNEDKKAVDILEDALDYIFDDDNLSQKVFRALKASYLALGNQEKAEVYDKKLMIISN